MSKVKQNIIPEKVVKMAKAMQEAKENKQQLSILQIRHSGLRAAMRLANGEQILPTTLSENN